MVNVALVLESHHHNKHGKIFELEFPDRLELEISRGESQEDYLPVNLVHRPRTWDFEYLYDTDRTSQHDEPVPDP